MEIDCGKLAAHVASGLGALKGYGHADTAAAISLQYVLDELMKAYEADKALATEQPNDYAGGQPERLLSAPSDAESCAPDRQGEALIAEPPAPPQQPVELSVNHDLLRAAIYADIDHGITGTIPSAMTKNHLTDSIMGTIEPFLAAPKRESVSMSDEDRNILRLLIEGRIHNEMNGAPNPSIESAADDVLNTLLECFDIRRRGSDV